MNNKRIFLAGHNGMVGSSILRVLQRDYNNEIFTVNKSDLNLLDLSNVKKYLSEINPDVTIIAAARVGGIGANEKFPVQFLYENLTIQNNLISSSFQADVNKLIFLGSSCIYPKITEQPIQESQLLTGHLEVTNEAYAIAKIAGIKLCESYNKQYGTSYRSVMPTNLYGPRDNYDLQNSHVIPGLIRKFHEAKENNYDQVEVWGSGKPKRDFLYSEDLAEACLKILSLSNDEHNNLIKNNCSHINVGSGEEISINHLASLIKELTKFEGEVVFDKAKKDGTPLKLLNIEKIMSIGWKPKISLKEGLQLAYDDFLNR